MERDDKSLAKLVCWAVSAKGLTRERGFSLYSCGLTDPDLIAGAADEGILVRLAIAEQDQIVCLLPSQHLRYLHPTTLDLVIPWLGGSKHLLDDRSDIGAAAPEARRGAIFPVHLKEIGRVILGLDLYQPSVVLAVVDTDAVQVIGGHKVHVAALF